jgi:hypothetical protein
MKEELLVKDEVADLDFCLRKSAGKGRMTEGQD